VFLHRGFFLGEVLGLDGEDNRAVLAIDAGDLGFHLIARLQRVASVFHAIAADFGGLQCAFDVLGQGDNSALGIHVLDRALHNRAFVMLGHVVGEWVFLQLLDTEGNALALRIDGENNRFDLVALFVLAHRLFAGLVPGDVGQVNQAVDAAFQADEDTEIGDRLDLASDLAALGVLAAEHFPGVFLALLHAQRDAATFFVDIQNHHLDLVAHVDDLRGMDILVGPIHFGDVDQAFHALFQFGKAAVIGEVGNLGLDLGAFRIAAGDLNPGIFAQLLQPQ